MTLGSFLILSLCTSIGSWYWARSKFAGPPKNLLSRQVVKLREALRRRSVAHAVATGKVSKLREAPPAFVDWVHSGINCQICSGQWAAWVTMTLSESMPAPWSSWDALLFGVAANSVNYALIAVYERLKK